MYEDLLLKVLRPARYIGKEWNVSANAFDQAKVKFALCFPDLYEVGMSNLGIRILYGILNNIEGVICERFFAVASDMEQLLKQEQREVLSLESRRTLKEFDIIGFSLGSELDYTNVLQVMDLGRIPLKAALRDHTYPLVIGGGPCTLNPEPMHEFFDLFIIGEAEELAAELAGLYQKNSNSFRSGKMPKQELLYLCAQLEGVYAPSLYRAQYNDDGSIKEFSPLRDGVPARVKKRIVRDFDRSFYPSKWLVPYIQIIHDRLPLEVMRGCPNRCRFCQARSQYFPLRIRQVETIMRLAHESFAASGYEEISLAGLSVSDYPKIDLLAGRLSEEFSPLGVSISLPSVKPREGVGDISSLIAGFKKTGLTFAPEAGSHRLREMLAKDFNEEEFFQVLGKAYKSGYQHVKLYFMIGLPGETENDLDAIVDFSERVSQARKQFQLPAAQVNISINILIPKPHTSLQWCGMVDREAAQRKQEYLRAKMRNKRLRVTFHNPNLSFLEGVLCRGDRLLSGVIERAFKKGCRFDAWEDKFQFALWQEAFQEEGIDPGRYLREKSRDKTLPWDFIEVGVSKESLLVDFNKVIDILAI